MAASCGPCTRRRSSEPVFVVPGAWGHQASHGQGLVEYAVILGLMALIALLALTVFRAQLSTVVAFAAAAASGH